jgi:hypothetical protein
MQRHRNHIHLVSTAALILTLVVFPVAMAKDAPKIAVKVDAKQASETPRDVAYQTLITFVPWALARAQKLTAIGDAERQAIFRAFAEQQLWRKGIAAGDGIEG